MKDEDVACDCLEAFLKLIDGMWDGPCPVNTTIASDFDGDVLSPDDLRRTDMNIEIEGCSNLDPEVVEMVQFFNENGLVTRMSCQGHNETNMSMFWIEFDPSITLEDIVKFQKEFINWQGNFCSNGSFAEIVYYAEEAVHRHWRYMAATIKAANEDLEEWKTHKEDVNKVYQITNFIEFNYENIVFDINGVDRNLLLDKLKEDDVNHLYELEGANFIAIWNCDLQGFKNDDDIYIDSLSGFFRMAELMYQDGNWCYKITNSFVPNEGCWWTKL